MHRRIRVTIVAAALAAVAGSTVVPAATRAAGAAGIPFAEAFDRARLVVVATVEAAPPGDTAYRLTVSDVVKGDAATSLVFPTDQTSVTLVAGTTVLLLAMDPASVDFRGTWVLAVAPDGTIDPDGLAGAPATVDELLAMYGAETTTSGGAAGSAAPSRTSAPPATGAPGTPATGGAGDGGPVVAGAAGIVGLLALVAIAALIAARVRATRRRG